MLSLETAMTRARERSIGNADFAFVAAEWVPDGAGHGAVVYRVCTQILDGCFMAFLAGSPYSLEVVRRMLPDDESNVHGHTCSTCGRYVYPDGYGHLENCAAAAGGKNGN